jgi:D-alanyl-D-alanine dipeptidase
MSTNETAKKSWNIPTVEREITNNILYISISDPKVKNIQMKESQEDFVDLLTLDDPRLKSITALNPKYENIYAGYSKVRAGLYQKLLLMLDNLPNDIGVVYFEGFRPLTKQKEYFDKVFKETFLSIKNKELAYQETAKLVSPFIENIPTHCTGAAIDISLFKIKNGKTLLLDMGKSDVIFGINTQHETFSTNITYQQRINRLLLLKTAINSGLVNYGYEWWHYSYGDKAWAYVKGEKTAIYGIKDQDNSILSIDKGSYLKQF